MNIRNIKTFQDMENYILERNRFIDCFDSIILQYLIQNMQEYQLVFIPKKDYFHHESIETILNWYQPYVQNKYSKVLPIFRGFISDHNEVWFQIPVFEENSYFGQDRIKELSEDYFLDENGIIWKQEWLCIRDSRMQNRITILYEDDCILIFVILIKVDKVKRNSQTSEFEFNHPIYQLDVTHPWQISLADHYYHHYYIKGYDELEKDYGSEYLNRRIKENTEILDFYRQELKLERKKGEWLYGNHVFKDKL